MSFIQNNEQLLIVIALGVAAAALALCIYLLTKLGRLRRDQVVVLGENRSRDLVAHGRAVQEEVQALGYDLKELTARLEQDERRLDDCLIFRSVIRYDAYRDLSGMQSTSMALLDAQYSGVIISAIQSREHARIYVKEVRHGDSPEKLSPEEIHVLKEAMGLKSHPPREPVGGGVLDD